MEDNTHFYVLDVEAAQKRAEYQRAMHQAEGSPHGPVSGSLDAKGEAFAWTDIVRKDELRSPGESYHILHEITDRKKIEQERNNPYLDLTIDQVSSSPEEMHRAAANNYAYRLRKQANIAEEKLSSTEKAFALFRETTEQATIGNAIKRIFNVAFSNNR